MERPSYADPLSRACLISKKELRSRTWFQEGMLSDQWRGMEPESTRPLGTARSIVTNGPLSVERQLHRCDGHGLGKNEILSLPADRRLMRHGIGRPGMKAILVYPLNALATTNVPYCPALVPRAWGTGPHTGRFTGQTTPGASRARSSAKSCRRPSFEDAFPDAHRAPTGWLLSALRNA